MSVEFAKSVEQPAVSAGQILTIPVTSAGSRLTQILLVAGVFVIVTGLWEFLVWWWQVPEIILPGPVRIGTRLVEMLKTHMFWWNFANTMCEVTFGYVFAVMIAVVLGVLISQVAILEKSLMPYVVAFQTIPSVALAPLFLQWFGYGLGSKVAMTSIIAFFPILVNVIAGLQSAGRDEIQMLKSFGATRLQILVKVRVPNALPFVFTGLSLGAIFSLVGAIVSEFVGSAAGLGKLILQYNENMKIADMFAVLIVLAATGMAMHCVIANIKKRVVFWGGEH